MGEQERTLTDAASLCWSRRRMITMLHAWQNEALAFITLSRARIVIIGGQLALAWDHWRETTAQWEQCQRALKAVVLQLQGKALKAWCAFASHMQQVAVLDMVIAG